MSMHDSPGTPIGETRLTGTPPLVGVDGCSAGWLALVWHEGTLTARIAPTITTLVRGLGDDFLIAIDIPIGLPDSGPRACDRAARSLLGRPRASSVFPCPVRECLAASTYEEAARLHRQADGRAISRQSFTILPKIREIDLFLHSRPMTDRVLEVHPEVSFAVWNHGRPMLHRKASQAGREERQALIDTAWPGHRRLVSMSLSKGGWKMDDLNDAFAALWTALRIQRAAAVGISGHEERDSTGVRMEIRA